MIKLIFVKDYKNFIDYVRGIKNNTISLQDHKKLFSFIIKNLKYMKKYMTNKKINFINHNRDVNILHFKYECFNDLKCIKKI